MLETHTSHPQNMAMISNTAKDTIQAFTHSVFRGEQLVVAPPGFEPGSQDPESQMMDHYTTGLHFIFQ